MKIQLLCIITLFILAGCSSAGTDIISSKIQTVKRPSIPVRPTDKKAAIRELAARVADRFSASDHQRVKVIINAFECKTTINNESVVNQLESLFRDSLIRFSQQGGFLVLEKEIENQASLSGNPIVAYDYTLNTECLELNGIFKLSMRLVDARTTANSAVFEASIPLADIRGDLQISTNLVYDMVTRLYWQRTFNDRNYSYHTAKSYCDGLILNGLDDWRIPDSGEIYTLIARPVQEKQKIFGYSYGHLMNSQGCHWIKKSALSNNSVKAVNLETGEEITYSGIKRFLTLSDVLECQIKCVRNDPVKSQD